MAQALLVFVVLFPCVSLAQTLPSEIRGYKVHRASISVHSPASRPNGDAGMDARVRVGVPKLTDISLTGVTFEIPIEASPVGAAGTIDFLSFSDFRVNGIPVKIGDCQGPINFAKDAPFAMPYPLSVYVDSGGVLEAAWKEFKSGKNDWIVTGRVFAFGKFKKMGLKFKRVVPIDVDVSINNPFIRNKTTALPAKP